MTEGAYQAPTTRGIAMAIGTGVKRAIFLGPKSLKQNQGAFSAWFAVVQHWTYHMTSSDCLADLIDQCADCMFLAGLIEWCTAAAYAATTALATGRVSLSFADAQGTCHVADITFHALPVHRKMS